MGSNMMLTIAAVFLFGLFVVAGNNLMSNNSKVAGQSEYSLTALALAQSIIDEAKAKDFDENSTGGHVVTSPSQLTASLGPEPGETIASPDTDNGSTGYTSAQRFDDVDDYNGYSRLVNTQRAKGYLVSVQVQYVSEADPESVSGAPTYCKRMNVSVTCADMSDLNRVSSMDDLPIRLSYVFAY
jgi:hypothetical protein